MQQNENRNNKWSRGDRLALLSFLTPFLFYLLKLIPFVNNILNGIAIKLELPLYTLNLFIILTLFVILSLVLSLLCIFKYHKKNTSYIPPSSFHLSSKPDEKLPPEKYMNKILLILEKNKKLYLVPICSCFDDSDTIIQHYLDLLHKADYIHYYSTDGNFGSSIFGENRPYILSQKGREYLVENNLLTK